MNNHKKGNKLYEQRNLSRSQQLSEYSEKYISNSSLHMVSLLLNTTFDTRNLEPISATQCEQAPVPASIIRLNVSSPEALGALQLQVQLCM